MITKIKNIRDQAIERWEDLLERTRTWWSSLAQRERIILGSAFGLFAAIFVIFIAKTFGGMLSDTSRRAESLSENGRKIQTLIQQVIETRVQADRFDSLSLSNQDTAPLKELLERQASRYGVTIAESKPSTIPTSLAEKEDEILEVRLGPETSLSSALSFLDAVQNRLGIRILHLKIIPGKEDRQKLNVEVMISKRTSEEPQ